MYRHWLPEKNSAINLWHFNQKRRFATLQGHSQPVTSVRASPDGRYLISSSQDCTTKVWSLEDRREVARYSGKYACCFSMDSSYAVFSTGFEVTLSPFSVLWACADTSPLQATCEAAIIAPYNLNCMHSSAFYNHSERCSKYADAGVQFLKGAFGSPLTVALQRKRLNVRRCFSRI